MEVKELNKRIRASLAYIGQSVPWLAGRLGISTRTAYRKLANEVTWDYPEVLAMKKLFRWPTLEG